MSKGLGTLQQSILNLLSTRGKWLHSWEVVEALCEQRGQGPTRAFDVSVRRAIGTMTKRGLLCSGENRAPHYRRSTDTYNRLACWLPEHSSPEYLINRVIGNEVDEMILEYISENSEGPKKIYWYGKEKVLEPLFAEGDVRYCTLRGDLFPKLGARGLNDAKVGMAINRAVQRLEKQGRVFVKTYPNGDIGLIRIKK